LLREFSPAAEFPDTRYADSVLHRTPRRLAAFIVSNSLLLPIGAVAALLWANTAPEVYFRFTGYAHFIVNDVGMTLFFALAAKEIVEATAPHGALHPISKAAIPVMAAIGGMALPAAIYFALVTAFDVPQLRRGWAIPTATDIAFSFLIARWLFGRKHPAVPFLLLLAIADDAFGLAVLALFYPSGAVRPVAFAAVLCLALALCWTLRRARVMQFWPYIAIGGALSWIAFFYGGLHPALALVPVVPFVPHTTRDAGLFEEPQLPPRDPLGRFEHTFRVPAEIVLFAFGLVNAGVPVGNVGVGTWIVLVALTVGKPVGVFAAALTGERLGARLPAALTRRDLLVLGCTAGFGFTVALFFATAAFPDGALLDQTKMGALLSFTAGPIAALVALMFRVGRFRSHRH
jgi:Na+:H+ antiporter, NhaA family